MEVKRFFFWVGRIILLTILYLPIWILGAMALEGLVPDVPSEPGLVGDLEGMLILGFINTLLILSLILTSRWRGWKLSLMLGLAYYGSFTFITQVESWYFLSVVTVSAELLTGLFIMGLPVPFLFIPIAVFIASRWKGREGQSPVYPDMPLNQFMVKLGIIAVIYLIIYWLAGYFIAWQNPQLRAFYGSPGEITPFWEHTLDTLRNTPDLFLLQLVRGVLFALIALPVIRGSYVSPFFTAILVGALYAVPHLSHILANPLMPVASVRISHMVETATSTFVFGLIVVWLLHRGHNGVMDFLRRGKNEASGRITS